MKKIAIGVIGVGHLGSKHAQVLANLENAHLIGVSDIDEAKGQHLASSLGCEYHKDYRQLLKNLEAAIIAVPTKDHFAIGYESLRQGCHVLIEKPITSNLKHADKLIKLAARKKRIIQVGHIERFNNAFRAVCNMVKEPKFIECHRLSPFPARSLDIGVVADLMIHDIDLILDLVRSKVVAIDAVGVNVLTNLEDIANVRLRFRNGCLANLTASRISVEPMRKFRIFLSHAYISLDYKHNQAIVYRKENNKIIQEQLAIEQSDPLKNELSSFLDCISLGSKPLVSGQEGKEALDLAIKIQKKINTYIKNFT